jgi:hypothetical protein
VVGGPEGFGFRDEVGVRLEGCAVVEGAVDFDGHECHDVVREVFAHTGEVDFRWDAQGLQFLLGPDPVKQKEFGRVKGAGAEYDFFACVCCVSPLAPLPRSVFALI